MVAAARRRRRERILQSTQDHAADRVAGPERAEDAEAPGSRLRIDARQVRETYLDNLAEHIRILRKGSLGLGVDYASFSTRTPFEEALAAYLEARAKRRR